MTFKKRTGGAWSDITAPKRREGGAWVVPTAVKVREGGAWVVVWPTGGTPVVSIANHTIRSESLSETNPFPPPGTLRSPGRATFQLTSAGVAGGYAMQDAGDGTNTEIFEAFTNWLSSGSSSDVEVMATPTFGAVDSGSATGVWLSMAGDQFWRSNTSSNASSDVDLCVLTIDFREAITETPLGSATITLAEGPVMDIT